eukprot:TRINITY_DN1738_c0_g1_i1.p4 TRINITY_DN1738_c0_g1~~TRINITY_DN1738_c0_g1_i1.p4  ORF type:complete len:400 (+),score=87.93 TRINITY_DN1738_c0_g1_i1:9799-10998(+)
MAELKRQHEELLELRRQKLVELLSREEQQYEQEFFANLETPEQVREKMAKRLHELKSKREQMRREEVQRKLDARFRQSADELRQLDTHFIAASTKIDQEQQMLEKIKKQELETQEEILYAKLCEADILQKEQREIEEREAKKKQLEEMMKVLNWQKETREVQKVVETRKDREEKEMLRTQWKNEDERAKALEAEKLRQMRELNNELIKHNALEKELKEKMLTMEKEQDKNMIKEIIETNKKQAELEYEMRLKRIAEAKETLRTIDNRAENQRQEELLIERLAEEEKRNQIAREDEKFMKEQEARIALLKEVYDERARAIETKRIICRCNSKYRGGKVKVRDVAGGGKEIHSGQAVEGAGGIGREKGARKVEEKAEPRRHHGADQGKRQGKEENRAGENV